MKKQTKRRHNPRFKHLTAPDASVVPGTVRPNPGQKKPVLATTTGWIM